MQKTKKERRKIKLRRARNRKLCQKYPWLACNTFLWTGEKIRDYKYDFTWLDDMPSGWRKAFGMMMVKEMDVLLRRANFQDEYRVVQVKEKYNELRWYDNGVPSSIYDEFENVIRKYSTLSSNICAYCSKPDTKYLTRGWIIACCEKCFKNINTTLTYEQYTEGSTDRMNDTYTIRHWNKDTDKTEEITYDIHETADLIRGNYERYQNKKNRRAAKRLSKTGR